MNSYNKYEHHLTPGELKEVNIKGALQMNDSSTTIHQLKDSVEKFKLDRDWSRYHTPQDLVVSISIEAAELLEIFQWNIRDSDLNSEKLARVQEELADVMIYCLSLANAIDADVATIINDKIKANAEKYPVGE